MMASTPLFLLILLIIPLLATSFVPFVPYVANSRQRIATHRFSSPEGGDGDAGLEKPVVVDPKAPIYDDDALYDDQVEYKPPELSASMKSKLLSEAQGLGADYNSKSPPYILYISGIILLLVAVGGQGIFF
mmetsp:Transcript_13243/g.27021  ORF Transcript_13243/g.27021 Transcript_13243/m.27021 type:complete len:131 (+) Transcript_13243:51-443(+)